MTPESELQVTRQANGGKLRAAFEQAHDNPGFRVVVVTKRQEDLQVQFSDLANEFEARRSVADRYVGFDNGSWVRAVTMQGSPFRLRGWRADLVLCDTRTTKEDREYLEFVIADPGKPGCIEPFSITLETA